MTATQEVAATKPSGRSVAVVLVLLMLLAAGLRLGVGLARAEQVYWLGDSQAYRELGRNLAEGRGLVLTDFAGRERRADRMPGYPLVLAALERVAGDGAWALLAAQAAVGALTVLLVYLLGREVGGPAAGLTAAALTAVMPWQVYFATVALTECWSAALVAATVLCVVRAVKATAGGDGERQRQQQTTTASPSSAGGLNNSGNDNSRTGTSPVPTKTTSGAGFAWSAGAGLACAALVYVHPEFLGLPAAFAVAALVAQERRKWLARWLLATVVIVAALAPWWVRNHEVLGRTVIATTRLGPTLYDGVRGGATGSSDMKFEQELAGATGGLSELEYDAYYRSRAWAAIWADPGRIARLAPAKASRLWSPTPRAEIAAGRFYYWASLAAFAVMAAGALAGLAALVRRRAWRAIALLLVPVVWVTLVHSVLPGSIRYRAAVEPLVFVLAGAAVAWIACRKSPGTAAVSHMT